ncbi:MAG: hypothetical protein IPP90_02115 [Gemmatimonadaceae bacterium]|nr:hypothetical protein [Gemmatimonadaceae bacterium]
MADGTESPQPPDSSPPTDSLAAYRAKRSSDTSPEPVGRVSDVQGRLFVVHKHAARQLHFDLRIEMDGVLRSWAVPRGPSYDMDDKRLAVKVEDHPIEYGEFEGVIPAGNYGAGGIIVWDRGEWVPLEDWREGLVKGKLLFELRGYKLHGKWALVKIKSSEKDWLLLKERDEWVRKPGDQFAEESVLSGLTVEEVKQGLTRNDALHAAVERSGASRVRVDPRAVEPMLAEPSDTPFTRDGWLFELKLDGYRLIAAKTRGEALLLTRNGNDYTSVFPEIARAVKALPFADCIVDGEVVVLDAQGQSRIFRCCSDVVVCRRPSRFVMRRWSCRPRSLCLTCWRMTTSICAGCRSPRERHCCWSFAEVGTSAHTRSYRAGRGAVPHAGGGHGAGGHHRQTRRRALSRRSERCLAQVQDRSHRGFCDCGVHGAQGRSGAHWRVAVGRHGERVVGVRGSRGDGVLRCAAW